MPSARAISSASEDEITSRPRLMMSTFNGLRDLGEDMTRDEHRATLRGQVAQEVLQPANALRVKPVGRLVEDQQLLVASSATVSPSR